MNTAKYLLLFVVCLYQPLSSQIYEDYLGNGHSIGITVTSSDEVLPDISSHAISGSNLIPDLIGASRFLSNATFGASYDDIEYVAQIGIHAWIDEQIDIAYQTYEHDTRTMHTQVMNEQDAIPTVRPDSIRRWQYVTYAFYDKVFRTDDVLRQRVAQALAQICLLYTSPSPRDRQKSRMPSSA